MRIPGPERQEDRGLSAIAAAGGLHRYQLRLHEEYGPVVRFPLPGADTAVSIADPVLLEATAHLDRRPEALFAFLDPLCEAGNLQVLPADEHTPWRRLLLSVLAGRRPRDDRGPGAGPVRDPGRGYGVLPVLGGASEPRALARAGALRPQTVHAAGGG
ncbi:hypothetical protein Stsp01_13890 [Streptomyces sp. NBRC 13847]|nr:hypothetical protein Stsp01_13890 [Streptomyces sp. NBRC 13847]